MDPTFRSSDVEFDDDEGQVRLNQHVHRGAASIEKLLSGDPMDRRLSSKKAVKKLNLSDNLSPIAANDMEVWKNRWRAFETNILGRNPQQPNAEDIHRFLLQVPDMIKSKGHLYSESISQNRLVAAFRTLTQIFTFEYPKFKLSSSDRLHTLALFSRLRKDGLTTKHRKFDVHWLGILMVKRMAHSIIQDALVNGTSSWDIVIYKALTIVLMSSMGARQGDIARSNGYTCEYLRWKHIKITIFNDSSIGTEEMLGMHITAAFDKGHKNDDVNRIVTIGALLDPDDAVICPVRLLITHALRTGACRARSIDEVFDTIRVKKTLPWTCPERPLICAIRGDALLLDVVGGSNQLNTNVSKAAERAGILAHVRSHDLRRGFARDIAHMQESIRGAPSLTVATAMGHTYNSLAGGVTGMYTGGIGVDVHTSRAKVEIPNDARRPDVNTKGSYRKSRTTKEEIDDKCRELKVDAAIKKNRQRAARQISAAHKEQWIRGEDLDTVGESAEAQDKIAASGDLIGFAERLLESVDDQQQLDEQENESDGFPPELSERQERGYFPIDPRLLGAELQEPQESERLSQRLQDILQDPEHPDAMRLTQKCEAQENESEQISYSLNEFIDKFSRINVTDCFEFRQGKDVPQGNSRDPPTPFIHDCPNHIYGCKYAGSRENTHSHYETCRLTSLEEAGKAEKAAREKLASAAYECNFDGCHKSFAKKTYLEQHRKTHTQKWEPRRCPDCVDDETVYQTKGLLAKHRSLDHSGWKAAACPVDGCKSEHIFGTREGFVAHIHKYHKLSREDMSLLLPQRPSKKRKTSD